MTMATDADAVDNDTACCKVAARQEAEAVRLYATNNQLVQPNRGGQGWTCEVAARQKVTQGGGTRQKATRQPAKEQETFAAAAKSMAAAMAMALATGNAACHHHGT